MPELPEVEHLRRTLEPHLVGARVRRVELRRPDVVHLPARDAAVNGHGTPRDATSRNEAVGRRGGHQIRPTDLLGGQTIARLERHGKNLALVSDAGRALVVHLGMSGQMRLEPSKSKVQSPKSKTDRHVHCVWTLEPSDEATKRRSDEGKRHLRLLFRDPRRFGGLWPFPSLESLREQRWAALGPDALSITPAKLVQRLARTRQPIKAALLNQGVLAGVGNIYADEALFRAGVHPLAVSREIEPERVRKLAQAIRLVLRRSIARGGTTVFTYQDPAGRDGEYAGSLLVYGRANEPCPRCGVALSGIVVAQRTTVVCRRCQQR